MLELRGHASFGSSEEHRIAQVDDDVGPEDDMFLTNL